MNRLPGKELSRCLVLVGMAALVTACPMDFATFIVHLDDDLPESAATYIGADKTDMECEAAQCWVGSTVAADGPGRIELVFADGTTVECAIPPMDFGFSGTMRFFVENRQCRPT